MDNSGDYISRDAAVEECDWYSNEFSECEYAIMPLKGALEILPAADVRPVVRGFNKLKDYPSLFECSVCGWECGDTVPGDTETYNFCPNCGADMRQEASDG